MKQFSSQNVQTVVLVLVIVGLVALALGGYLTPVSHYVLTPIVGAQTWLATRFQALRDFVTEPTDNARLRQRNAELEAEVSRLQAQIVELEQQTSEVEVLSALVNFASEHPENKFMAASVIGYDTSPFMKYVLVNRGSDAGLRRGMPVVTSQGLVGRIDGVTAGAARVQLITDPASKVNVQLKPSGAEGILAGSVTAEIGLSMIPQDATLASGDLVFTSGLGGNYPADILIGQVTSIHKLDYNLFQSASVQPVVDFTKLNIVMVITNFQPVDVTPLIPEDTNP